MQARQPHHRHPSAASVVAGAERADDNFFDALVAADVDHLGALLHEDFQIVEVLAGAVVDRASFIESVTRGLARFRSVEVAERAIRRYGDTAIIVGRTRIAGCFAGADFDASSRYTHVLTRHPDGVWQLVNAQGTRISQEAGGA